MLTQLTDKISGIIRSALPGEEAHRLMAPAGRTVSPEYIRTVEGTARKSAVLIALYEDAGTIRTVLIKRPDYQGVHSGQVAFPGGKAEDTDHTLEETALREAWEETGIIPGQVQVIGRISQLYIPPSNFLVTPVIGVLPHVPDMIPEPAEVAEILTPGLPLLLDDSIIGENDFLGSSGNWSIKAPCFNIMGHAVWGATAMMLSELRVILQKTGMFQ